MRCVLDALPGVSFIVASFAGRRSVAGILTYGLVLLEKGIHLVGEIPVRVPRSCRLPPTGVFGDEESFRD